ncbi:MAG: hypothetical protein M3Y67_06800 [Pseudomonadota bacterium]|nr:hypothetical protein [Pseudomonadota bacterium]
MSFSARAGSAATPSHRAFAPILNPSVAESGHLERRELAEVDDGDSTKFKIFAVQHTVERTRASALLQRRYAWRGYSVQPLDAGTSGRMTLSAALDRDVVATITASLDSADGFYVESVYPGEVQALRAAGRTLCEFTKLAVDESLRSQALLAAIFHVAFIYVMEVHGCTDALIEVNPRHVRFYEQMLGFRQAAEERLDPSVNAPAVLMRLDLQHCAREIDRLGGRRNEGARERSFYPHFFGRGTADEIVGRLRTH